MTEIKAISTKYKGYNFRSRLEARWAVFFDIIGLNWEYEIEGYDLGEMGYYLPDFIITSPYNHKYVYEIKPRGSNEGQEKLQMLLKNNTLFNGGCVLNGDPVDAILKHILNGELVVCPRCGYISYECGSNDYLYCRICDFETPSGGGHPEESSLLFEGIKFYPHKGDICLHDESLEKFNTLLMTAAYKARSARFEHGESGAT
jgi:hypothetical protein